MPSASCAASPGERGRTRPSDNPPGEFIGFPRTDNRCIAFAVSIPALFRPAPLRRRLWQGAIALALFIATFLVGNFFIARNRAVTRAMLGHDFLAFYTAGTFARTGQFELLYNLQAVRDFEQRVARESNLEIRDAVGPFWNPPFYAWLFAPLSRFSFPVALSVWTILNLLALAGSIVLLCRMLPGPQDWRSWALVPVLIIISMPFIQAITHAQNTFMSLLLLSGVVTAWRKQRDVSAGILCGLLFYKPQLAVIVAVMLIISRGLRVCLGLGFALGSLCLITALTMPDAIGDYLHRLPIMVQIMQVDSEYLWERHITLKAFWRLLIHGRGPGDTPLIAGALAAISCAAIGIGLIVTLLRDRRASADDVFTGETKFLRRDRLIGATIAAMPLLMPFYFDYDLLLLAVPAVLFAGEVMVRAPGHPLDRADKLLLGSWIAMYLWLMINPGVGRAFGINVTVMLLTTVSLLLIRRSWKLIDPQQFGIRQAEVIRVTARRAA